ncbi:MAG: ribonuclease H-like domain-containing protein, partial [Cytophagales bacterium]
WEVTHYDTMEMWRFGDKKAYTSLELLAAVLEVETSKSDIDGSQVNFTYYSQNDLSRIAEYCKRDVATLANIYLRLNQMKVIPSSNIFLI